MRADTRYYVISFVSYVDESDRICSILPPSPELPDVAPAWAMPVPGYNVMVSPTEYLEAALLEAEALRKQGYRLVGLALQLLARGER